VNDQRTVRCLLPAVSSQLTAFPLMDIRFPVGI
jgi:hypothetical protein